MNRYLQSLNYTVSKFCFDETTCTFMLYNMKVLKKYPDRLKKLLLENEDKTCNALMQQVERSIAEDSKEDLLLHTIIISHGLSKIEPHRVDGLETVYKSGLISFGNDFLEFNLPRIIFNAFVDFSDLFETDEMSKFSVFCSEVGETVSSMLLAFIENMIITSSSILSFKFIENKFLDCVISNIQDMK